MVAQMYPDSTEATDGVALAEGDRLRWPRTGTRALVERVDTEHDEVWLRTLNVTPRYWEPPLSKIQRRIDEGVIEVESAEAGDR